MIALEERKPAAPGRVIAFGGVDYLAWWVVPLCGGSMLRLNLYQFYRIGHQIHQLAYVQEQVPVSTEIDAILAARKAIEELMQQELVFLQTARESAKALIVAIDDIVPPWWMEDDTFSLKAPIASYKAYRLVHAAIAFETVLGAELAARSDVYSVAKKGIYDTSMLIDSAELMLPDGLLSMLPKQAEYDLRQGGRCLAFETPTAAGFHFLRAVECLIKAYYEALAKAPWPERQRDWGRYIRALEDIGAPPKITTALGQIKGNYRNPLMHPEDSLETDEAIGLFGVAIGVITLILQEIAVATPKRPRRRKKKRVL